ncbi:MAG: 16S rRNA (cytidine(1402)-2'-O)-methyltransferase [Candidatus Caldipriscus sp.]|jgi:16S rRNA (cytidine1402-2'-O)-methyltransferase
MSGKLFVVATPIGNLEDITLRAIRTLKECDFILCEDTRRAKILLKHYGIEKPLISYFEGNEEKRIPEVIDLLKEGKNIALISDAGTPLISDPGYRLVKRCREEGIDVLPVPGPSAVIAALSVSGLETDRFTFLGFPPQKKGKRRKLLKEIKDFEGSIVFYVSPYDIKEFLEEVLEVLGDRRVCICREMTKFFEEYIYGKLSEVKDKVKEKGEFVVVVGKQHF